MNQKRWMNIVQNAAYSSDEEKTILFLLNTKYVVTEDDGLICHRLKDGSLKLAGTTDRKGYRKMMINGKEYYIHRLVWLYCHGIFPRFETDHIDGNRTNNRISNLRDVTKSENQKNRKLRSDNKSGCNGVYYDEKKGKYQASISLEGRSVLLGTFKTLEEAAQARELANVQLGYSVNHGKCNALNS